jgi:hypothetical protein
MLETELFNAQVLFALGFIMGAVCGAYVMRS